MATNHVMIIVQERMLGAARHGIWTVPGGALTEADYRNAVQGSGFAGITLVGTDLAHIRLPAK
jgi:ribonuclease Z